MAVTAGRPASVKLGVNTKGAEQSLKGFAGKLRSFAADTKGELRGVDSGFKSINKSILAGAGALSVFGVAGTRAMAEFRGEMLQVQYLYRDMDAAQRRVLEQQTRVLSRSTGVGTTPASSVLFRLGSTGTGANQLAAQSQPILRAAAAMQIDAGGLALATGQGANLANMSREEYLNLLIATGQASTADVGALQALAPRVLPGGNVLGLSGGDTMGILAAATQVSGTPEEATTGVAAIFAEATNKDSKFAKAFQETMGKTFTEAIGDKGAAGFFNALTAAYEQMGKEGFFSSFGRRAGTLATSFATSDIGMQSVRNVLENQQGALDRMWQAWSQELPHSLNLVKTAVDELRKRMGEGAHDGVMGALEDLIGVLNRNDVGEAIENFGDMFGRTAETLASLVAATIAVITPLVNVFGKDVVPGPGQLSGMDAAGYLWAGGQLGQRFVRPGLSAARGGFAMTGGGVSMMPGALGGVMKAGLGMAGWGLLGNELIKATTNFDVLGESVGKLVPAIGRWTGLMNESSPAFEDVWQRVYEDGQLTFEEMAEITEAWQRDNPEHEPRTDAELLGAKYGYVPKIQNPMTFNPKTGVWTMMNDWAIGLKEWQSAVDTMGVGGLISLYGGDKDALMADVEGTFGGQHNEASLQLLADIRDYGAETANNTNPDNPANCPTGVTSSFGFYQILETQQ